MIGVAIPPSADWPHGARDLTDLSPTENRVRMRRPSEVTCVVLHQTAFERKPANSRWRLVAAHAVVLRTGETLLLHPFASRLRRAANAANASCISIELEGNLRGTSGRWWAGEKFGRTVAPTDAQVESALALGRYLAREFPSIRFVTAHRQWHAMKANCCGPQIWSAIAEPLKRVLGLTEGPTGDGWAHANGSPIPNTWRSIAPAVEPAAPLAA